MISSFSKRDFSCAAAVIVAGLGFAASAHGTTSYDLYYTGPKGAELICDAESGDLYAATARPSSAARRRALGPKLATLAEAKMIFLTNKGAPLPLAAVEQRISNLSLSEHEREKVLRRCDAWVGPMSDLFLRKGPGL